MKKLIITTALLYMTNFALASEPPFPSGPARSIGEILNSADVIVYGVVSSIGGGECGPAGSVGYMDFHVLKVIKGRLKTKQDEVRVCASARLIPSRYLIAGRVDDAGLLIPEWDGFVMHDGLCNKYFHVDFDMQPYVTGADGNVYFTIGRSLKNFLSTHRDELGDSLNEFQAPESPYTCLNKED